MLLPLIPFIVYADKTADEEIEIKMDFDIS